MAVSDKLLPALNLPSSRSYPDFKSHIINGYNVVLGKPVPMVLRLVKPSTDPSTLRKGELLNTGRVFYLSCPLCGQIGLLPQRVMIMGDRVSMSPSVECPNICGFHDVITGWELRKGG